MTRTLLLVLCFFSVALQVLPQSPSQKATVLISATVQNSPPGITLNWEPHSGTTSITIYRKLKNDTSWGNAIATPGSSSTQHQDNSVQVGVSYEYKIVRSGNGTATGYINSGIEVPVTDYRGKMVLLVDNTLAPQMVTELNQLTQDLKADGWWVLRSDVSRTAPASDIRNIVQGHYNSDPTNVKAVYMVGRVPVPYSGNQAPDGHGEHVGAWPCDGYYGEMNSSWTDNSVNNNGAQRTANRNIPGDGKFDQSNFPSDVELQVGRVDLFDMPAFSQSELQLVKNYLNRAHSFKIKGWTPLMRGLHFDNLQWVSNPIGASGLRNMGPLTGPANITNANQNGTAFHNLVNGESYLWTYSSGGGGQLITDGVLTFNGANNIGTTQNYAGNNSMGGVFNMSCGSYFGDWDNKNNFLRAPIAKGEALTSVWAGIPAWYFHHMGLGENIGYSTRATMNNNGLYTPITEGWQGAIGKVHLALHGDPSLRMQMIAPPTSLSVSNAGGTASFNWSASSETVLGYHIYKFNTNGTITRLTTSLVTGTSYQNISIPFEAGREYMVRAVKLQVNHSGSYYNLSLGAIVIADGNASSTDCQGVAGGSAVPGSPCNDNDPCTANDTWNSNCQCVGTPTTVSASITAAGATSFCTGGSVVLNANTGSGLSYVWRHDGNTISGATNSNYTAQQAGVYTVRVSNGSCEATSTGVTVTISSAPTASITAAGATNFCSGGSVVLNANTGSGFGYVWRLDGNAISGATNASYTATQAGVYTVRVNSGGCETTSGGITVTINSAPSASITAAGSTTFCTGGSVVLNANTGSGLSYIWRRDGNAISGATNASYTASLAGIYTVRISNGGCETTSSGITVVITSTPAATITAGGPTNFCFGGSVQLNANTGSGLSYVWRRDGTTINGANSASYSATQAGVYTVRVNNGGCETTSSGISVTTTSAPTATITPAGPTSFCSGGSVVLIASTSAGSTYAWRRDGNSISGATSASYTASQAGVYTVRVSNGGCETTSSGVTVTITSAPVATVSASGSTNICSGASVVLNANTGNGYTYTWRKDGNVISGATAASYSATQSGAYSVQVGVGGCTATSSAITVSVNAAPAASITASGPTSFCSGGSVVLNGNTGSGLSYIWRRDGNAINGANGVSYSATQSGVYTVRVSNGGCETTSSEITVVVNSTPAASLTAAGPTTFCSNGSVLLNANTGNGFTYVWRRDGVVINGAASASYTAMEPGVYSVQVGNNGCTATSSGITVTVNSTPSASITATGGTDFCSGGSVQLDAITSNGSSYVWRLNGTVIAGATTTQYSATVSGIYTVEVSNSSCSTVSAPVDVYVASGPFAAISLSGDPEFCVGGEVVMYANEATDVTYSWQLNGQTIPGAVGSSHTAQQPGSFTVTVTGAGCDAVSAPVVLTTYVAPAPDLSLNGPNTICAGEGVTITAPAIMGASYHWAFNGVPVYETYGDTFVAVEAGVVSLHMVAAGCITAVAEVEISMNELPESAITVFGPTSVCTGDTVLLQATQDSSYSYTWMRDGILVNEAVGATYSAVEPGSYAVVVDNGECTNGSAPLIVSMMPDVAITTSGPTAFCAGDSVTITAVADSAYSYTWSVDGVVMPGDTAQSITVAATGIYMVTIESASCSASSEPLEVAVSSVPVAMIEALGPLVFCSGDSVVLHTMADSSWSYQWLHNGEVIEGASTNGITALLGGTYSVDVTNGGCTINSGQVIVTTLPVVTLEIDGPTAFCSGDSVVISASAGEGHGYTWYMDGTILEGDTSYTLTTGISGDYQVMITDGECAASSEVVTVSADQIPMFELYTSGSTTFCYGNSVDLSIVSDSTSAYTVQWSLNGELLTGATLDTLVATNAGMYTATVSNGGCALGSDTITVTTLPVVMLAVEGAGTLCEGGQVVLSTLLDSGYAYQWFLDGELLSEETGNELIVIGGGAYHLSVQGDGCAAMSDTITLEMMDAPEINCYADVSMGMVGVDVLNGSGPYSYMWNGDAEQDTTYTTIEASGTYTITVTNSFGCSETCEVEVILDGENTSCLGLRTETQAFWSTSSLLSENFAAAFPNDLTIGCGFRTLTLTSAEAVADFLPSQGPSLRLPFGTLVDPGAYGNSLAGELVAIKLAVRFDEMSASFSAAGVLLKDAVVAMGTFQGMTVSEVIAEADLKIGGCFSWYSRNQLRIALENINNGYSGGTMANGYLECPEPADRPALEFEEVLHEPGADVSSTAYPNPFTDMTTIVVGELERTERITIEILSTDGVVLERIFEGEVMPGIETRINWNAGSRAMGVYYYRVMSSERMITGRLILQ